LLVSWLTLYTFTSLEIEVTRTLNSLNFEGVVYDCVVVTPFVAEPFNHQIVLHLILLYFIEVCQIWLHKGHVLSDYLGVEIILRGYACSYSDEDGSREVIILSQTWRKWITDCRWFSTVGYFITEFAIKSNSDFRISRVNIKNKLDCLITQFSWLITDI